MAKQRTEVADIDRSLYDFSYGDSTEKLEAGLTPEIVREISEKKDEPEWMLQHRLKSLEIYQSMPTSDWGPSIAGLDMDNIVTYVKPNTDQKSDWDSLPDDVKNTFDRLGIPEAE
ncbi:MAG: Fe-S cluster assembly protein SufB, partial [Coriobacteriia bacterium]|nr:Fe-S cluster assembly protein SufB [Coriobacteriia bacterium]